MTKLSKFLNIALYVILAVTLVLAGMFFLGGDVAGETYKTPVYTESFLNWAYVLIFIAAGISLVFEVVHLVLNPKNAVRTLISIGLIAVVTLVSYGLADTTPLDIVGYQGTDNVPSMLSMSGTFLYVTYILLGAVVVSILYAELSRLFK